VWVHNHFILPLCFNQTALQLPRHCCRRATVPFITRCNLGRLHGAVLDKLTVPLQVIILSTFCVSRRCITLHWKRNAVFLASCGLLSKPFVCEPTCQPWCFLFFLRLTPASTSAVVDERGPDQGCSVVCPFLCSDVNVIVAVIFSFAFISGCYCHRIWPSRQSDAPTVPSCTPSCNSVHAWR